MNINVPILLDDEAYSFAYQPIINMTSGTVVSYEALVRGAQNEPAHKVLEALQGEELYRNDEGFRIAAIKLAATLGLTCDLNLNFLPLSLETSVTFIKSTLDAAKELGIRPDRIILDMTEEEIIRDIKDFTKIINEHRDDGIKFAIDDFGASYAGLNLLADFQPDFIKIDIGLVRSIQSNSLKQAVVKGIVRTGQDLAIDIIAEGIETPDEYWWFREEGVELFQGYLFAKPAFQQLPLGCYPV